MKKLYTFLGMALLTGSVSAQTYIGKDFEDLSITNGGFTTQVVVGTADWFIANYSSNNFAKMSNYSGGSNSVSETWMITPAIDLTTATTPIFSFSSSTQIDVHSGPILEVFTSVDYDGTSDPTTQGTWTTLTPTLSTGNYDWVNSGEITVANTSATTFFAFKYTGSATDGATWQIDSVFVAETGTAYNTTITGTGGGTGTATAHSIFEIQNSAGDSPYKDSLVSTGGIVTYVRSDGAFYIGSGTGAYSGVYVFETGQTVAIGDSVTFDALVDEFYDLTELKNLANFVNVSSGNFFMSTAVTTAEAGTEAFEGVLVSTCGAAMTEEDQYQEYELNDGSGGTFVDNYSNGYHTSGTNFTPPAIGTSYTVKGIVDYAYSAFKILPRTLADVAVTSQCVVSINENEVAFNVYPNPANTELNIDVEGNNTISILDLNGKTLKTITSNGFTTVDISDLASGIYMVRINNTTKRIAVK